MENKKYYSIPYISNSTLSWFKVSPKYCWKRMNHEIYDEDKSYTFLGRQLHLSLLEPEEFEKTYTYLDFKTPSSKQQQSFCEEYVSLLKTEPTDFGVITIESALVDAYKSNYITEKITDAAILKSAEKIYNSNSEYIKYLEVRGDYRDVLSKSRKELITTITNAITSHKKANSLMFNSSEYLIPEKELSAFNELAIYWEYPIECEGEYLKCKSLIDRLVVDHLNQKITIVDLKTTSTLGDISDQIDEREYYRQLAFYRLAVQHSKTLPNNYEIEAYIVAVNTQDPFECRVYKLSDDEYHKQLLIINDLMQKISWHWFTNQWEYSRTYYEGDGTENLINENSNKSIEEFGHNRGDKIYFADAEF
jgi:hypothetical protein